MNLNCNCIKNRCMHPMLRDYVEVKNSICNSCIWFNMKYFYDGTWYNQPSRMILYNQYGRVYYQRSSVQREVTIFKRVDRQNLFIFNTLILKDDGVCFEVTGDNTHSFINEVPC